LRSIALRAISAPRRNQRGDRLAVTGDGHKLAPDGAFDEAGKAGLGVLDALSP
jgi:hypothetical protein